MILVDTSIWVDYLRASDRQLEALLNASRVLCHPFVVGEVALGNLGRRHDILSDLSNLPTAVVATDAEVLRFIDHHGLAGRGIGYVDVHLLASVRLTPDARLWSRDRRLHTVSALLGMAFA